MRACERSAGLQLLRGFHFRVLFLTLLRFSSFFLTTFSRFLFVLKWKEVFSGKKLNESLQNVVLVVPLVAGSLRRRCCFDEVPSLGYCLPGRSITCLSSVE